MAFSIELQQSWTIKTRFVDGKEQEWMPDTVNCCGKSFVCIGKWIPGFVRTTLGHHLRLKKGSDVQSANVVFLDQMDKARQDACSAALKVAFQGADDDNNTPSKRKREIVARKKHHHSLPPVLAIKMDGFHDPTGFVQPRTINVLSKDFWTNSKIWVEATDESMLYIFRAVREDVRRGRTGKTRKASDDHCDADEEPQGDQADNLEDNSAEQGNTEHDA